MTVSTSSFDIGAFSHPGRRRAENQDNYMRAELWPKSRKDLRDTYGRLYIVADGVGGNDAGGDASAMVVNQVMEHFYYASDSPTPPTQRLRYAIERASQDIHEEAVYRENNMASTVVAALIQEGRLIVANVGDSSALLFRRGEKPQKLTIDHLSINHDGSEVLSQAMGDLDLCVTITPEKFRDDDIVVLCTDGLTNLVTSSEIGEIVSNRSASDATRALIRLANERGGYDNITALVVRNGKPRQSKVLLRRQLSGVIAVFGFVLLAWIASTLAFVVLGPENRLPMTPTGASSIALGGGRTPGDITAIISATVTLAPLTPTSVPPPPTNPPKPLATRPAPPRLTTISSPAQLPTRTEVPTQEPTVIPSEVVETSTALVAETSTPALRSFRAQIVHDFHGTAPSDQRQSCIAGRVLDRAGRGVAGAVLYANNGPSSSPTVQSSRQGTYSICDLVSSNWSVVLTFVPRSGDPSRSSLGHEAIGVIYVNGSPEQIASVNFVER